MLYALVTHSLSLLTSIPLQSMISHTTVYFSIFLGLISSYILKNQNQAWPPKGNNAPLLPGSEQ